MTDQYDKGVLGEKLALEYLEKQGMVPLQQRYHSSYGEIDLVMRDGDVLALVEVKYRPQDTRGKGADAITPRKRACIFKTARCYLAEHPFDGVVRFDVVEITRDGVWYIPSAFEA